MILVFTGRHRQSLFTAYLTIYSQQRCAQFGDMLFYSVFCFVFQKERLRRNHVKVSSDHNIELVIAQWF